MSNEIQWDEQPVSWDEQQATWGEAEESSAPVLSSPTVIDITATSARPQVTLTY